MRNASIVVVFNDSIFQETQPYQASIIKVAMRFEGIYGIARKKLESYSCNLVLFLSRFTTFRVIFQVVITSINIDGNLLLIGSHKKEKVRISISRKIRRWSKYITKCSSQACYC